MTYNPGGNLITKDGRTSQFVALGFTDTFSVHLDAQAVAAQKAFMLIDVSDTTNWPHINTSEVILEYIIVQVDPDSSFSGEVKIGFLLNVDGTDGDFHQIMTIDMARKSDLLIGVLDFGSHGLHCTTDSHFGPIIANSTLFQTDVNLQGPDGNTTFPSGNNDFAMIIERTAGTVDVSITLGYETAP